MSKKYTVYYENAGYAVTLNHDAQRYEVRAKNNPAKVLAFYNADDLLAPDKAMDDADEREELL